MKETCFFDGVRSGREIPLGDCEGKLIKARGVSHYFSFARTPTYYCEHHARANGWLAAFKGKP